MGISRSAKEIRFDGFRDSGSSVTAFGRLASEPIPPLCRDDSHRDIVDGAAAAGVRLRTGPHRSRGTSGPQNDEKVVRSDPECFASLFYINSGYHHRRSWLGCLPGADSALVQMGVVNKQTSFENHGRCIVGVVEVFERETQGIIHPRSPRALTLSLKPTRSRLATNVTRGSSRGRKRCRVFVVVDVDMRNRIEDFNDCGFGFVVLDIVAGQGS